MNIYLKNAAIEDKNEDDIGHYLFRFELVVVLALVLDI